MIKNLLSKFTLDVYVEFGSYELKILIPKFQKFDTFLSAIALDDSHTKYQLVDQYYNPIIKKNLKLFYPFKGGTIVDYHSAEILLKLSMEKMLGSIPTKDKLLGIDYYASLHSEVSEVQISAISDILNINSGNKITYIPEAIGVAKSPHVTKGSKFVTDRQVVCHIGHSVTELLAIEGTNIISRNLIRLGVRSIHKDLQKFILDKYQCQISDASIHVVFFEEGKVSQGSSSGFEVTGKSIGNGKPTTVKISVSEFNDIVRSNLKPVVNSLNSLVSSLPTSFTESLNNTGIFFSGGASKIFGLKSFFAKEIGIKIVDQSDKKTVVDGLVKISNSASLVEELQVKDFIML